VRARVVPGGIRVEVADTGVGIGDGATAGTGPDTTAGTGLSNLRERLRLALGATCSVRLEATADETRAVLELPDAARVRAPQTA